MNCRFKDKNGYYQCEYCDVIASRDIVRICSGEINVHLSQTSDEGSGIGDVTANILKWFRITPRKSSCGCHRRRRKLNLIGNRIKRLWLRFIGEVSRLLYRENTR